MNPAESSHAFLTAIADTEGIGQLILNVEGVILHANEPAEALLRSSRAHLVSNPIWGLSGAPKIERFKQLLEQVKQQGVAQEELSLALQDGTGSHAMKVTLVFDKNAGYTTDRIDFFFKPLEQDDWRIRDLERKEARYRLALESAGIGIWDMDIEKNETFRSPLHDAHFGYPSPCKHWGYDDFISHVHDADKERVARAYHDAMVGGEEYDVSFRVVWPDGSVHWQWTKGRFYLDAAGKPLRVAGLTADITEPQIIKEEMELARRSINAASEGICIVDAKVPDMPMIQANPAFYRLTGYTEEEIIGRNCRILQGPDTDQDQLASLRQAIEAKRQATVLLKNYKKSGEAFWNELTIAPVKDRSGEVAHFVGVQRDVTQEILLKADLQFQASYDELTGLSKRRQFESDLKLMIDQSSPGFKVGVYFFDVDHFKRINDFWDHATGDLFLKEMARRLQEFAEPSGITGRFGGDEFYLAVPNLASLDEVQSVAQNLLESLSRPFRLFDHVITNTVSIGVSAFPNDGVSADNLIAYADDALLQAKRSGRAIFVMFDEKRLAERLTEFSLEKDLKTAIDKRQLKPFYQAKFNSLTNQLTGFEALVRWIPREGSAISPAVFIPIAEQSGLIHQLGRLMIEEVFQQIQCWRNLGYQLVPVAINVSNLQLESDNLGEFILERLRHYEIAGSLVEIELTETVGVYDTDKLTRFMRMLKPLGVTFAIDDFGTGHSNLCYLRQFPFDCLKIDRQFVAEIRNVAEDAAICRSIVALADIFNMKVVGEGVEDQETADFLQKIGCFELQGFLYATPVDAESAASHLNRSANGGSLSPNGSLARRKPDAYARAHSTWRFDLGKQPASHAIQTVVELVRQSFDVDHARFHFLSEESGTIAFNSRRSCAIHINEESFLNRDSAIIVDTLKGPAIYTVPDLSAHPVYRDQPVVSVNKGFRFYAGVCVYAPDGKVVGVLSLVGRKSRHLSGEELTSLHKFANLIEESLFQSSTSRSMTVRRLWNERDYRIELPQKWREAARNQQSFALLSVGVEGPAKNDPGVPAFADRISGALGYLSDECGAVPYRLEDDSFRLLFIGCPEDEISDFWLTLSSQLSHSPDGKLSPLMMRKMGFVTSASGSTNDLSKLISEIDL